MSELWRGRYLAVRDDGGWEHATRVRGTGVVGIVALDGDAVLLVEQHRPPVGCAVMELPAGLVGDEEGTRGESLQVAAERELLEETGYRARAWRLLSDGPSSAGISDERLHLWLATDLERVGPGGGDASEAIVVHRVPVRNLHAFLRAARNRGVLVDPKVFLAALVAGVGWDGEGWMPSPDPAAVRTP